MIVQCFVCMENIELPHDQEEPLSFSLVDQPSDDESHLVATFYMCEICQAKLQDTPEDEL